jgi:hypothetical protein
MRVMVLLRGGPFVVVGLPIFPLTPSHVGVTLGVTEKSEPPDGVTSHHKKSPRIGKKREVPFGISLFLVPPQGLEPLTKSLNMTLYRAFCWV